MGIIIFLELYKHFGSIAGECINVLGSNTRFFFLLVRTLKDQLHLLVIVQVAYLKLIEYKIALERSYSKTDFFVTFILVFGTFPFFCV